MYILCHRHEADNYKAKNVQKEIMQVCVANSLDKLF